MRYKKTEICQTCAKVKNVCQTCVLDLQYGLPVEVRDKALEMKSTAPTTDINRQYFAQNLAKHAEEDGAGVYDASKLTPSNRDVLKKLARSEPYYKRNRPHLCSFYLKGECKRGDECPYRHELPGDGDLTAQQNIRDRYNGTNDPVAGKMLNRVRGNTGLAAPEDKAVVSFII
jgi:pre-mRNA-splicing factor RBM22/SLT11